MLLRLRWLLRLQLSTAFTLVGRGTGSEAHKSCKCGAVAFIRVQRVLIKNSPRRTHFHRRKYERDSRGDSLAVCHIALASSGKWQVARSMQHGVKLLARDCCTRLFISWTKSAAAAWREIKLSICQLQYLYLTLSLYSFFLFIFPLSLFIFVVSLHCLSILRNFCCPFCNTFSRFCCLLSGERASLVFAFKLRIRHAWQLHIPLLSVFVFVKTKKRKPWYVHNKYLQNLLVRQTKNRKPKQQLQLKSQQKENFAKSFPCASLENFNNK